MHHLHVLMHEVLPLTGILGFLGLIHHLLHLFETVALIALMLVFMFRSHSCGNHAERENKRCSNVSEFHGLFLSFVSLNN